MNAIMGGRYDMESNQSIIITKCVNGFIVNTYVNGVAVISCNTQQVFQSMQELVQFIRKHFDYRNHSIEVDLDATKE
jgi:uncharacterized protein YlxP (DUF503 family)